MPKIFAYREPSIPSAGVYYFTTDQGVEYEVRFGRKQADILCVTIVFGVINEEYEGEEYVLTNKGEFYDVMATIETIINDFKLKNPNVHSFEFSGEPVGFMEDVNRITRRTNIYMRNAKRIFSEPEWLTSINGNKVSIDRVKKH